MHFAEREKKKRGFVGKLRKSCYLCPESHAESKHMLT